MYDLENRFLLALFFESSMLFHTEHLNSILVFFLMRSIESIAHLPIFLPFAYLLTVWPFSTIWFFLSLLSSMQALSNEHFSRVGARL